MKFLIVFEKSGDFIEFTALNSNTYELLEYYVSKLNHVNLTSFSFVGNRDYIDYAISNLHTAVAEANTILKTITDKQFDTYANLDNYLDQNILNKYHSDWVNSHSMCYNINEHRKSSDHLIKSTADRLHAMFSDDIHVVSLGNVLDKLRLHKIYENVNQTVHSLEQAFNQLRFSVNEWIEFDNLFSKTLITNDSSNFKISFNHLGRPLYNKYQNFDTELVYNDENTWDQLLGFVDINFARTHTHEYSPEYIAWCKKHNREPTGNNLNIGNIIDLEKRLTDYRLIMYRNIRSGNSFNINLSRG